MIVAVVVVLRVGKGPVAVGHGSLSFYSMKSIAAAATCYGWDRSGKGRREEEIVWKVLWCLEFALMLAGRLSIEFGGTKPPNSNLPFLGSRPL